MLWVFTSVTSVRWEFRKFSSANFGAVARVEFHTASPGLVHQPAITNYSEVAIMGRVTARLCLLTRVWRFPLHICGLYWVVMMSLRGLPLLCLCFWSSQSLYRLPLKMFSGKLDSSVLLELSAFKRNRSASGSGLALASDPAGNVNFLNMVDNLEGDAGRGYYLQMFIGTPGQKVSRAMYCLFIN